MRARVGKNGENGFTLIEMVVVVGIIGLMMAGVSVTVGNVTNAKLRSAASRISNSLRFAFNRARVTGNFVRLAMDLDKGVIWLEASEEKVALRKGQEQQVTTDSEEGKRVSQTKRTPMLPLGDLSESEDGEGPVGIDAKGLLEGYEQDLKPVTRKKSFFQPVGGVGGQ
ncbi:MAG: prepilin-type N-terminal cleavage/methylation domain-containing protein, partial [Pseudomonadota bacterium]